VVVVAVGVVFGAVSVGRVVDGAAVDDGGSGAVLLGATVVVGASVVPVDGGSSGTLVGATVVVLSSGGGSAGSVVGPVVGVVVPGSLGSVLVASRVAGSQSPPGAVVPVDVVEHGTAGMATSVSPSGAVSGGLSSGACSEGSAARATPPGASKPASTAEKPAIVTRLRGRAAIVTFSALRRPFELMDRRTVVVNRGVVLSG